MKKEGSGNVTGLKFESRTRTQSRTLNLKLPIFGQGWRSDELSLRILAVIFFLIFRFSELLSVWSSVSFQIAWRKVVFINGSSRPFDIFAACFEGRNEVFISLWSVFVQGEFMILISESYWSVYLEFRLSSRSAMSFYLPCCYASRKPITRF